MEEHSHEEVKKQILKTAFKLFCHYGFNKTTMVEVASDCRMLAANLYRYFENKDFIGMPIVSSHFSDMEQLLREILRKPGLSASECLEAFILIMLNNIHKCLWEQPRIFELIDFFIQKQPILALIGVNEFRPTRLAPEGSEFDWRLAPMESFEQLPFKVIIWDDDDFVHKLKVAYETTLGFNISAGVDVIAPSDTKKQDRSI